MRCNFGTSRYPTVSEGFSDIYSHFLSIFVRSASHELYWYRKIVVKCRFISSCTKLESQEITRPSWRNIRQNSNCNFCLLVAQFALYCCSCSSFYKSFKIGWTHSQTASIFTLCCFQFPLNNSTTDYLRSRHRLWESHTSARSSVSCVKHNRIWATLSH